MYKRLTSCSHFVLSAAFRLGMGDRICCSDVGLFGYVYFYTKNFYRTHF